MFCPPTEPLPLCLEAAPTLLGLPLLPRRLLDVPGALLIAAPLGIEAERDQLAQVDNRREATRVRVPLGDRGLASLDHPGVAVGAQGGVQRTPVLGPTAPLGQDPTDDRVGLLADLDHEGRGAVGDPVGATEQHVVVRQATLVGLDALERLGEGDHRESTVTLGADQLPQVPRTHDVLPEHALGVTTGRHHGAGDQHQVAAGARAADGEAGRGLHATKRVGALGAGGRGDGLLGVDGGPAGRDEPIHRGGAGDLRGNGLEGLRLDGLIPADPGGFDLGLTTVCGGLEGHRLAVDLPHLLDHALAVLVPAVDGDEDLDVPADGRLVDPVLHEGVPVVGLLHGHGLAEQVDRVEGLEGRLVDQVLAGHERATEVGAPRERLSHLVVADEAQVALGNGSDFHLASGHVDISLWRTRHEGVPLRRVSRRRGVGRDCRERGAEVIAHPARVPHIK